MRELVRLRANERKPAKEPAKELVRLRAGERESENQHENRS